MIDDPVERAIAAEMARQDLYFFSRLMFKKRKKIQWQRAKHHKRVAQALMRVYRGECKRLLLHLPPRYSKTELGVVNFIAWCLGKNPDSEFLHLSYSSTLAEGNTWNAREVVDDSLYREIFPGVHLDPGTRAQGHWRTSEGGIVYAAGFDGTITGKGAGKMRAPDDNRFGGAIVIDDPHKANEALSETMLRNVRTGFQTTIESRKNDARTPIIVIMQRLHEHDLAGWLASGGNGESWEIVKIPVFEEIDTGETDGNGLPIILDGDPIWPEKHSRETLLAMEEANPYVFAGQYRQRPAPPAGGNIKPGQIGVIDALPVGCTQFVRGWDLAASTTSRSPFTAGVKLARAPNGRTIIVDVVRERGTGDQVRTLMRNTADRDGASTLQSVPQDPGQAGKVQAADFAKLLLGHRCVFTPESGDKVLRAEPIASQINIGNVDMLRGPWNQALINEAQTFPNGYKDQIDALSRAFSHMDNSMERFLALAGGAS